MVDIRSHTAMRGLAAFTVMISHYVILVQPAFWGLVPSTGSAPHVAVDFFFMLSGFILARVYHSNFAGGVGPDRLILFYGRRLVRIWPLHALTLLLMLGMSLFQGDAVSAYDFLLNLFLIDAWGLAENFVFNVPSWSISCEIAAYLLFPFAMYRAQRHGGPLFLLAVSALGYGIILYVSGGQLNQPEAISERLVMLRILAGFPLGMALAGLSKYAGGLDRLVLSGVQILCLISVAAVVGLGLTDIFVVPAFALLIFATAADKGIVADLSKLRLLRISGEISYGLYMIHWFIIMCFFILRPHLTGNRAGTALELAYLGAFVAIVFGLSYLSYTRFEMPLRALVHRPPRRA